MMKKMIAPLVLAAFLPSRADVISDIAAVAQRRRRIRSTAPARLRPTADEINRAIAWASAKQ